jgi:membrane AbrB-like protein
MHILITFLIAFAGGAVLVKLKVPAGAMIGAMVAVAVFNIISGGAEFPAQIKIFVQTISGLFIGCKIIKSELGSLRRTIKPAAINVIVILGYCLFMGVALYLLTDYSFATCAFSTAPGSMVDMAIISMDMGADASVVSVFQLLRLVSIVGVFPWVVRYIMKKNKWVNTQAQQTISTEAQPQAKSGKRNWIYTLLVAAASGIAGYFVGIPAGALVFSMVGVGGFNILTDRASMPFWVKRFAQICAGALIGNSVSLETIISLKSAILPAVIMLIGLFAMIFFLSWILSKTSGIDPVTALFSCAPGGASDIALMAEDFGADTPKVSIIQTMRVVLVIILYPIGIKLISVFL